MKGFVLGLLLASCAWGGFFYFTLRSGRAPIASVVTTPDAGVARGKASHRRRRQPRRPVAAVASGSGNAPVAPPEAPPEDDNEPEPMELSAADLRSVGRGDDLSSPDVLEIDMGKASSAPELTQDDIDARFRARQGALLDCIAKARPDEVTFIAGRVTVKFRIQRTGQVRGVRVDAPAILQQGGLYTCIKNVVVGLRFPASNGSQVVTYPFQLS